MPKFVTIGYGDKTGYDRTDAAVRQRAHAEDARLKANGCLIGIAGKPVSVRNPNEDGVDVTREAYMKSGLPIAGFAIIEAATLEDAIDEISKTPCAVAYGVVEVWPLDERP